MTDRTASRRRGTVWSALLIVASVIATLVVAQLSAPAPARAAPLRQTTVMTWNMQGGNTSTDNKWRLAVLTYARQTPILMLQESGAAPPASAVRQPGTFANGLVTHYLWNAGSGPRSENYHIYFLVTDPNGHRVNTAVVTRRTPDEIVVVPNPVATLRGALGVRFGNDWYFSWHGSAGNGGSDAPGLVAAVNNFVRQTDVAGQPTHTWTIGGDFNRQPDSWAIHGGNGALPGGATIYNSNQATHQNQRELDYIITDRGQGQIFTTRVAGRGAGTSDHYPVRVGAIRAAAGSPKISVNVSPSGDQITAGLNDTEENGYRTPLLDEFGYGQLSELWDKRDLVGSTRTGTTGDTDDNAYLGATVNDLYDRIAPAEYNGPNKQVVFTLHVGTNDLAQPAQRATGQATATAVKTPEQVTADLQRLIEKLLGYGANKSVMVSTLIPSGDPDTEARITQYNADLTTMVQNLQNAGDHVMLADMSKIGTADLADGTLPNPGGYRKMADAFYEAIGEAYVLGWLDPGSGPAPAGPVCAIYRSAGTPCGIAVSTTRVLVDGYAGPLYQVQRVGDQTTKDIGSILGGYSDSGAQDAFCGAVPCVISKIYDQTDNHNDLTLEIPQPGSIRPPFGGPNHLADAKALPVMLDGHKVYGVKISGRVGYRNNKTKGIATGTSPEGMYMVASGTYVNDKCCFDFGNAETDATDHLAGTMDAVNLGTKCFFADSGCANKPGPWVEADLENGLFNGGDQGEFVGNQGNPSNFVTAMLKNGGGNKPPANDPSKDKYALSGGDAQGGSLSHWWEGPLPSRKTDSANYKEMRLQGAVVLGTGGDNSNQSIGSFFEGVMVQGYPSGPTEDAVHANVVAARYTGDSRGLPVDPGTLGDLTPTASQAVTHEGYTSVFTVDPSNGHLTENVLVHMGEKWQHQDLTDKFKIPAVLPGTQPVTLMHDGYLSVFTVETGTGHVWQSWISHVGEDWNRTDLSTVGTPPTDQTPTAVYHDGYASVYTVNLHRDLNETYLRFIGDTWHNQDLSDQAEGHPCDKLLPGTGPVALFHGGYTSVYYVGPDKHLKECFLPHLNTGWDRHDLFAIGGAPLTVTTPGALVHDGYTSVYTVSDPDQHLWESYFAVIGAPWVSHDLSKYDEKVTREPTPNVAPGTHPVAMYHGGYASVFTVDENSQDVQETFLTAIGDLWHSQDFTTKFGVTHTVTTPIPLLHPSEAGDNTFASVFYVDEFTDHLQEAYTPAIGVDWVNHDLSATDGVPPVLVEAPQTNQAAAVHDGYTSVYTVDRNNGHLWESYLTAMGQKWNPHDLNAEDGIPPVAACSTPVVVVHEGVVSVFTVNTDGTLEENFLIHLGQHWNHKNVTAESTNGSKVRSCTSPSAVYHHGFTSVYTVDPNGKLKESFFDRPGQPWTTIDLPGPAVEGTSSPAAVLHSGWVSVFTVDTNHHLQQDYLPALGDAWINQDMTTAYGLPAAIAKNSPAAVVHQGWTSVFSVDANNHLRETYLRGIGTEWVTQDLTDRYQAPTVHGSNPPVPLYHTGYTSVYTMAADSHLWETYLPAIGVGWGRQDMTTEQKLPLAAEAPSAVLHHDDRGGLTATSVYVVQRSNLEGAHRNLWEGYLHRITERWIPTNFREAFGGPPA